MKDLELFKEMLKDNMFEVAELLRQYTIIYKPSDELNACFEAYKLYGEDFSYALSDIFAKNARTSNFYDTGVNEAFGIDQINNPFASNQPTTSVSNTSTTNDSTNTNTGGKFNSIFSTVTNVLNTGIGLFSSFQVARGQRDAQVWRTQQEYYDRQKDDKAGRNILIVAVLVILAIVAIIIFKKK